MKNAEIIQRLVSILSRKIEWRLEMGDTYAQARARIVEETSAGPAVWAELDAIYS